MLCNDILYVLGREMTGGLADEGPALFNYAAAFLDEDNTVTASGPRLRAQIQRIAEKASRWPDMTASRRDMRDRPSRCRGRSRRSLINC